MYCATILNFHGQEMIEGKVLRSRISNFIVVMALFRGNDPLMAEIAHFLGIGGSNSNPPALKLLVKAEEQSTNYTLVQKVTKAVNKKRDI